MRTVSALEEKPLLFLFREVLLESQAQFRGNPKSFKPPKTPVGQCFEHRPRNAPKFPAPKSVPRDQMTRSQKRFRQRRFRLVEWRLSTLSQQGWLESRKRPTLSKSLGKRSQRKKNKPWDKQKDSGTFKSEGRFDRKEDEDDGDDDLSKKVVLKFGSLPPKVAVNYVLPRVFGPKENKPE